MNLLIIILSVVVFLTFIATLMLFMRLNLFSSEQRTKESTLRQELLLTIQGNQEGTLSSVTNIAKLTQDQLQSVTAKTEEMTTKTVLELKGLQEQVAKQLESIRSDNEKRLEAIRVTVDEKLHETMEQRLGESFKLVSDQLSRVNTSLGEMQTLAEGVGDLKRVLSNVKTRGILGEYQLGAILEDILTRDQYLENVATRQGSSERVEYAIRLPGRDEEGQAGEPVLLPIDAKFPKEDYERLLQAQESGDLEQVEASKKAIRALIKSEAKTISAKYIDVPHTTDFAILFLPFEGLYAEILNMPGIVDELQREHRVVIAGPTTLGAILNSLQMGFKTLAIQKRSSEVWQLLGAVKTEFEKFGTILDKMRQRIDQASHELDSASRRSRTIQRRLGSVDALPAEQSGPMIGLTADEYEEEVE